MYNALLMCAEKVPKKHKIVLWKNLLLQQQQTYKFSLLYQRKHKWLSSFDKGLSFNVTWMKWIINNAEHVFLSLLCYFSSFEKIKYQKKMQLQEIDL